MKQQGYQKFFASDPLKANALKMDQEALARLETYARENLVCIKCGKPIPAGDSFKMHITPAADGTGVNVRIACYPCFGYEADGKTKRPDRIWFPVRGY
jgi:hypothetical protein